MTTYRNTVDDPNLTTALGGAPGASATVYLDRNATDFVNASGNDISANAISLLHALPEYTGNAGWSRQTGAATGGPVKVVTTSTGRVVLNWGGSWFYLASTGISSVVHQVEVNPTGMGRVVLSDMLNEYLVTMAGMTMVAATANTNRLYAGAGQAEVTKNDALTMAEAIATGTAVVRLDRNATAIGVKGAGRLIAGDPVIAPTTVNLDGGTLVWMGGAIGTLNAYGGVLDLTRARGPVAITTRNLYGPITIRVGRSGYLPTVTTDNVWVAPAYETA